MREVRLSLTYREELTKLLAQGVPLFGPAVVAVKHSRIIDAIRNVLTLHPKRPVDPVLGICTYPVTKTPFALLYDFDDLEVRIHLIIHGAMDRTRIDLTSVRW